MWIFVLLLMLAFASEQKKNYTRSVAKSEQRIEENRTENVIFVQIEGSECIKENNKASSVYIGVSYRREKENWEASRWSKDERKLVHNGTYKNEETAARASDTLARKLMKNCEQDHRLNFPDENTDVYPEEKKFYSKYIGVTYNQYKTGMNWCAQRRSKNEHKMVYNGYHENEETAAHASDTLARALMANGEQDLNLNFPDDNTEVYPKKVKTSSKYIGVNYNEKQAKWHARRWSKNENKVVYFGCYKDEETAAYASDTLARKLVDNGEHTLKLNFPDEHTELYRKHQRNKRKRSDREDLGHSQSK